MYLIMVTSVYVLILFINLLLNSLLYFDRMDSGEQPKVKIAANIFRELCYNNRDNLSAGIIVAGWDKSEGGQVGIQIYRIVQS